MEELMIHKKLYKKYHGLIFKIGKIDGEIKRWKVDLIIQC